VRLGVDELIVSLDGATAETIRHIRGGADLDRITTNLKRLRFCKASYHTSNPKVSANFVMRTDNIAEAKSFLLSAHKMGIGAVKFQNIIPWNKETTDLSLLGHLDMRELRELEDFINGDSGASLPNIDFPPMPLDGFEYRLPKPRCRMPFFGPPNVRVDGKLMACTFVTYPFMMNYIAREGRVVEETAELSPLIMGDLKTQSIEEIWNSGQYKELRKSIAKGNPVHPCDICLSQFRVVC
jgi:MoaA/NifB/PqqE/SkfB family radical SAM enzyme